MTVCLVLQGDSASPGAREKMCSGFPYWRRSMPSTCAGGWRGWAGVGWGATAALGHPRVAHLHSPWAVVPSSVPGTWQPGLRWGRPAQRQKLGDVACGVRLSRPAPSVSALVSKSGTKTSPTTANRGRSEASQASVLVYCGPA